MSLFLRLRYAWRAATAGLADQWYYPQSGGGFFYGGVGAGPKTKSGAQISEFSALQLSVVWCCIKVLSEDTASLPLHLYRRLPGGGKEHAVDHPLYSLMHDSPNPEMTAMAFREAFAGHLLSWGNGYAEKEFGRGAIGKNRIVALWPIAPHRVQVFRDQATRQIGYKISMPTGTEPVVLGRRNMLHCPGLSYDGLVGYSPIAAHREAIGLGKALEEFGGLYFGQGTHPGIIVTHPGALKPDAHANLKASLAEAYSGLGKAHRLMLLEDGMKPEKIGIPNNEAQFLESRKYQNVDIGTRIYRLFPQQYGEYDKSSTYASAEQFSIDYVTKVLRAWLVRLEQAYDMALLQPEERGRYFFRHNIGGLLRGDQAARGEFYQKLFSVGGITPNIIAELEDQNPIGPEGDRRFVPLNYVSLDQAGKQPPASDPTKRHIDRICNAYAVIFRAAAERIVNRETLAVKRAIKSKSGDEFTAWADEFCSQHGQFVSGQMLPAISSLSEALEGPICDATGTEARFGEFSGPVFADLAEQVAALSIRALKTSINVEKPEEIAKNIEKHEQNGAESLSKDAIGLVSAKLIEQIRRFAGFEA